MPRQKKHDELKGWLLEQKNTFIFSVSCTAYSINVAVIGTDKDKCKKQLEREHKGMEVELKTLCQKITLNG